jgi:3-phenylpropionate/cinnamic acid dioxygenase small subunit
MMTSIERTSDRRHGMRETGRLFAMAALSVIAVGWAFGADSAAARLQRIEDRQAIEQLLMGDYPRALDSGDWAAYAALFAKDGTLVMGGGATKRTGPPAIQQYFSARPAPAPAASASPSPCPVPAGGHRTEHVVNNLTLQINGDMATDQAYWQTIVTRDCKSVVAGAGHYEDVLKREDGHWKFFKREIVDDIPPRTTPAAPAPAR